MKTKWLATKRFERSAPQTWPQYGGIGIVCYTKREAVSIARRENSRHGSGYIVLPMRADYAKRYGYANS